MNIKGSTISHIRGISYREPYRKKKKKKKTKPAVHCDCLFFYGRRNYKTETKRIKEYRRKERVARMEEKK